jgi:hypothetical protein
MGCSSAQEKIKKQISILNKEKNEIKKEREEYLKKLEIIEGCKVIRTPIPDYNNKNKTNLEILIIRIFYNIEVMVFLNINFLFLL